MNESTFLGTLYNSANITLLHKFELLIRPMLAFTNVICETSHNRVSFISTSRIYSRKVRLTEKYYNCNMEYNTGFFHHSV